MLKPLLITVTVILSFFLLLPHAFADSFSFSLNTGQQNEPPPPPAGAPHRYQYYPSSSVYFDSSRGLYFYLSGSNWQVGASLPNELRVRLGSSVSIEADTDKPYIYYDVHRKKYPPGQLKKVNGGKGKKFFKK